METEVLKGKTLLVVDDEVDLRDIVASELEFMGAKVFQAENILAAQKVLAEEKIDLIISDIRMPGGTGIDLLDVVKNKHVDVPPMILITGFADITLEDAFQKGAEALLNKPFKLDDLIKMAVRYTSPMEERFKENEEGKKDLPHDVDTSKIKFGRGGFAMEVTSLQKRYDVGELVNFDFNYEDKHFEGSGICRWLKTIDHTQNRTAIGLEFTNLKDQSFTQFQNMNLGKTIIPYIPSFY